ncbi:MAG: hypothetical protein QME96_16335, partial [Myxococcota bacterium]|nr:hypothetical protein [Myxococcota bacterium]
AEIAPLVERLARLIDGRDMESQTCVAALRERLAATDLSDDAKALESLILRYDFTAARGALSAIASKLGLSPDGAAP